MKLLPQNEAVLPQGCGKAQEAQKVQLTRFKELLKVIGFTRSLPKVIEAPAMARKRRFRLSCLHVV